MYWITDNLAVGGLLSSGVEVMFREADWVVNVAQETSYGSGSFPPFRKGYIKYGVGNVTHHDENDVWTLVSIVNALLRQGQRVVVHCAIGMNRSPAIAICVLMHQGRSRTDAVALVRLKRPGCEPFMDIVDRYEEDLRGR